MLYYSTAIIIYDLYQVFEYHYIILYALKIFIVIFSAYIMKEKKRKKKYTVYYFTTFQRSPLMFIKFVTYFFCIRSNNIYVKRLLLVGKYEDTLHIRSILSQYAEQNIFYQLHKIQGYTGVVGSTVNKPRYIGKFGK